MAKDTLTKLAKAIAKKKIRIVDLTQKLTPSTPDPAAAALRADAALLDRADFALRRQGSGLVLEQHRLRRTHRHAFRCAGPLDLRQGPQGRRD